jgi:putative SOS response-associated peptidase YedK
MGNHQIMPMAGLWEAWKNPEDGQWLRSCTVVTTEANELMAPIHDRMPVILGSEDWERWLGEGPANDNELKAML